MPKKTYFYIVFKFLSIIILSTALYSCMTVPEYKKSFLNEDEMGIGLSEIDNLNNNSKTYREGSQGANGGKSGGGCGCN